MKNIFNKNHIVFLSLFLSLFISGSAFAQSLPANLNNLDDDQLYGYFTKAKAQGYTLEQIKAIARTKGVSASKIAEMEQKLANMESQEETIGGQQIDNVLEIVKDDEQNNLDVQLKNGKDPLFGYDFFNNSSITFTPNINLATPESYQLGPGDDLVINIWGAAENIYNTSVDREGVIRISGVGPVYVNGLSIVEATKKIKGALARIYSGIKDADRSPSKVFVSVSLSNVRTVQVDIIGEVKVPGTYSLNALSSVLNALYASGGPTKKGTFRDVKLVRNGINVATFDIYKYLIEGSQKGNNNLQDGDVLIVSPYISRITVSGAIKRPGVYEIKPEENFADLIDFMGGFESNAYKDLLILERIDGDRRKVKEVLLDDVLHEALKDGDKMIVNTIIDKYVNRVQIEGAVYRPGTYELTEGLTLENLITKAAGVSENAFVDRGLLFSTKDELNEKITPFSVKEVLDGKNDITLRPNDRVRIFSKEGLKEKNYITIDGAVNKPSRLKYLENATIEDLIMLGGGLKMSANANKVDVYRKVNDDKFETLSESFQISADGKLAFENNEAFFLEPGDRVSVRFLKGSEDQLNVSVRGESNYPGSYAMGNRDMKISDLLEISGGISPYAFVEGASLIRLSSEKDETGQAKILSELDDEELEIENIEVIEEKTSYRVGISLKDIMQNPDSNGNLILKNGDVLVIPSVKETVKVEGEVLVPSLIRYQGRSTLKEYINKSGGFGTNAKRSKTFVVYANGDIATTKQFLFFRSYPKLLPGAVVLVPSKEEQKRSKMSTQEIVALSTSVASFAILIQTLAN